MFNDIEIQKFINKKILVLCGEKTKSIELIRCFLLLQE